MPSLHPPGRDREPEGEGNPCVLAPAGSWLLLAPPAPLGPFGRSLSPFPGSEGSGQPCWGCAHIVPWGGCTTSTAQNKAVAEFICTLQQAGTPYPPAAPRHCTTMHEALLGSPRWLLRVNLIIAPWGPRGRSLFSSNWKSLFGSQTFTITFNSR